MLQCSRFQPGASSSSTGADWRASDSKPALSLWRQTAAGSCKQSRRHRRGQCLQTLAAVASAGADVQTLLTWLSKKGVNTDKLAVTPIPDTSAQEGGGLALRCKRGVSRSESTLAIPEAAWLTPKVVKSSALGAIVQDLDAWLQLALFLLYERQQGQSSAWQGYVSSLPAHMDTPLSWTEEELAPLQGSQLYANLQGYREFFKDLHERLRASLFQQNEMHFTAEAFSYENFLWAVQTVRSRVHSPLDGKNIALVPLADLVHHRRSGKSRWKVQSGLFGKAQAVSVDAVSPLEAGELLAMDFGPDKLDSSLLLDYGVLDASSPQPGFLLSLGLPEQDRFFDDKADVLDLNGLAENWQFTLRPGKKPSTELMVFLRLLNLTGPDAFLLEALFRNEAWGHLSLPVSEENEAAVCRSMLEGITEALQGYVSSIDEDLAMLRQEGLPPRVAKAVQVCLGEKEALEYTLQWFETHQKSLDNLEYYQERRLKGLGLMDDAGRTTWNDLEDGIA